MKSFALLIAFCSCVFASSDESQSDSAPVSFESFSEELFIKPLPTGHVYSHFEFTTTWANNGIRESLLNYKNLNLEHYDLFPRALGEVVEKYGVRELHLTLTQGLWRHHKWGYPLSDAPPGATLWVWFNPASKENLDANWRGLVNALSGLFCASLNFIDDTNTASPQLSYRPAGVAEEWFSRNSSYLRFAALARENVCTENLTPWKKLLPCDTKAGLASILLPGPVYSSNYHSLGVHLRPACQSASDCDSPHLELVSSLSMVQSKMQEGRQDFSFRHLYSSPLFSTCPLAVKSMVYIDVTHNEDLSQFSLSPVPDQILPTGSSLTHRAYAVYDVRKVLEESRDTLNVAVRYTRPHVYRVTAKPPLLATRYIAGYGQEGGSIRISITNSGSTSVSVVYLELLPWYLRLYLHQTQHSGYLSQLVTARDRERGWVYERVITVAPHSTSQLSLPFTRALLKWLEYPPDANHGFYLPSATLSVVLPSARNLTANSLATNTLLDKLHLSPGGSFLRIYTESLLVSLPTPDFSMPYNVICLACTVVALAFGPIHNITTKRLALKKIDSSDSKVSKMANKIAGVFGRGKKEVEKKVEESKEADEMEEETEVESKEEEETIPDEPVARRRNTRSSKIE